MGAMAVAQPTSSSRCTKHFKALNRCFRAPGSQVWRASARMPQNAIIFSVVPRLIGSLAVGLSTRLAMARYAVFCRAWRWLFSAALVPARSGVNTRAAKSNWSSPMKGSRAEASSEREITVGRSPAWSLCSILFTMVSKNPARTLDSHTGAKAFSVASTACIDAAIALVISSWGTSPILIDNVNKSGTTFAAKRRNESLFFFANSATSGETSSNSSSGGLERHKKVSPVHTVTRRLGSLNSTASNWDNNLPPSAFRASSMSRGSMQYAGKSPQSWVTMASYRLATVRLAFGPSEYFFCAARRRPARGRMNPLKSVRLDRRTPCLRIGTHQLRASCS
mmetsp:Transcript_41710/g.95114  ORF Transcript_41710/g.95114 Transcript_41710/m.95114 type:complete len:336 (+) Transcript_41710:1378-2385(+)